ncbi:MAG: hypothetical protein KKA22_04000 [Gammaproteobacteria bacterium]|nr:hypothetical protein [Gammaproteobacteria bacterium]MBU1407292.1 hypothetical protein [Gammaproteobacteria bacterium]MBU1531334.1 hypothetical protein [Gammaproteobacteria bacterium]
MDTTTTKNRRKIGRVKRPDSAALARPRKIIMVHAGGSAAFRTGIFDGRTKLAKLYKQHVAAIEAHLGGDLTPPQSRLVDQAARLALLTELTWAEIDKHGVFKDGDVRPAVDSFLRTAQQERDVLRLLGIERRQKAIPSLDEYLKEHSDV